MQALYEKGNRLIQSLNIKYKRSLFSKIDWKQRLIEIKGSRGVGKTTIMLQKAFDLQNNSKHSVLYATLDDAYFFNNSIFETADNFYKYGGQYLFLDEVHKYPTKHNTHDWSAELKNIYDLIPDLKVVYSGSSIIELYKGNGDLSRRKSSYSLNGLSFREYLELNNDLSFQAFTIKDIINNHNEICNEIVSSIKILPLFQNYLKYGYYPFFRESPENYFQRIKDIINVILEVDIPSVTDISFETISKIKTMLAVIATSVPYVPNLTKLSSHLNISDLRTFYKYLSFLENAELIVLLRSKSKGNKMFQKPQKIFLNNTNIINAITGEQAETGTLRETFFCNQLNHKHKVSYPEKADFLIDNKFLFEIGGKNKTTKQIHDADNSYIALDNIEYGFANKIPLWLFGFLY